MVWNRKNKLVYRTVESNIFYTYTDIQARRYVDAGEHGLLQLLNFFWYVGLPYKKIYSWYSEEAIHCYSLL